ncbi:MAG TPA: SPASM domain-containing protein [Dissulfurispiraceae bacterium]|nr:SPASM domain-containing protein [Dissulfurispiraceae bacterium]
MRTVGQFHKVFELDQERMIIFDLLLGTHEIVAPDECQAELDPTYKEYEDRLKALLAQSRPSELNLVLLPSYACNMRCPYCFEAGMNRSTDRIEVTEISLMRNQVNELIYRYQPKVVTFTMMGGEPLAEPNKEWFRVFFRGCPQMPVSHDIMCITNGLDTASLVDAVEEFNISSAQVTLDGVERIHNRRRVPISHGVNSFQAVVESVDFLISANRRIELRVNVDFENIPYLKELNDFVLGKGWNHSGCFSAYLYPITDAGCGGGRVPEMNLLRAVLKELRPVKPLIFKLDFHGMDYINRSLAGRMFIPRDSFCGASKNQFVFGPFGNISTCWWGSAEDAFQVGKRGGNGYRLEESWLAKWRNRNVNEMDTCLSCAYKYVCGGGCAYKANQTSGDIHKGNCAEFDQLIQGYVSFLVSRGEL